MKKKNQLKYSLINVRGMYAWVEKILVTLIL